MAPKRSIIAEKKHRKTPCNRRAPSRPIVASEPVSRPEEIWKPAGLITPFDPNHLLTKIDAGKNIREYREKEAVFAQGDAADAVFFLQNGRVQLTVVSAQGKEAVVAILQQGSFFGEGCLAGQPLRMSTASTVQRSTIMRVEKSAMLRLLHQEPEFAESFLAHILSRNIRMEADLVNHLFNSSEKRLARLLLLLANFGQESEPIPVIAKISQETLAEMVGTTRSRVSFFMNRFRDLGFIDYNGGMHVHSSLVSVVLHD
jgi:CRP-like cAMP-binding protein